jgi:hypothetical protein
LRASIASTVIWLGSPTPMPITKIFRILTSNSYFRSAQHQQLTQSTLQ